MAERLPAQLISKDGKAPSKETMTTAEAIASFNEDEKVIYEDLQKLIDNKMTDDISWYWNLGQHVAGVLKKSKAEGKHIGGKIVHRLQLALGYKSNSEGGGPLHNAVRFVDTFETKANLGTYLKLRSETDKRLSYSQLIQLAYIENDEDRMRMAVEALDKGYTAEDIGTKMRQARLQGGGTSPHGGSTGRPHKVPSSPERCLDHITAMSGKIINLFDSVWLGARWSLQDELKRMPPDHVTPEFCERIGDTLEQAAELRNRIDSLIRVLTTANEELEHQAEEVGDEQEDDAKGEPEDEYVEMAQWKRDSAPKRGRKRKQKQTK